MKIAFYVLGCKVNRYEAQALSELFIKRGFEMKEPNEICDVYVVYSCTVTATSDAKSKKAVNHFRKLNPNAVIVLMGCFPQAFNEKASKIQNADIILGTKDRKKVIDLVENFLKEKKRIVKISEHPKSAEMEKLTVENFDGRTRAFVKIQDGCNRFCSYCIIPYARGRICSKPLNELKEEIQRLVKNGFCEFVLVGIDLSAFGKEFSKTLTDAVETVASVNGVKRIRLGSLEPETISDEDIKRLSKIDSFCPQFHLSLQSGCDKTLKRMNRHYSKDDYRNIVNKLRENFDDASITTDIMVGFAGESEEDFNESLDFACEMRFLKAHVFPYSVREGTRAAEFTDQIDGKIKKERSRLMIEKTEQIRKDILESMLGTEKEILLEGKDKGGYVMGYTKDYVPVYVKCSLPEASLVNVRLVKIFKDGCLGEIV